MMARITWYQAEEFVESRGYTLLDLYVGKGSSRVVIRDGDSYKYDTNLNDLKKQTPRMVDKGNCFAIYNISLWLIKNNKGFELCDGNEYLGNHTGLKFHCLMDDCNEYFCMDWTHVQRGQNCPFCRGLRVGNSNSLLSLRPDLCEDFSDENDFLPSDVTPQSGKWTKWKCHICGYKWGTRLITRSSLGTGCPACAGQVATHNNNLELMFPKSLLVWDYDKNEKSPNEFSPHSHARVFWRCENEIHDGYRRKIDDSVTYEFRCPECVRERNNSVLQEKVSNYISSYGHFTVCHEYNCTIIPTNPETSLPLPFDNEIKELSFIIEVNGEHHYKTGGWNARRAKKYGTTPQQELEYQQWKDANKKEYALSQGYYYLEIPYWYDNEEETWKQAINEMIEYILQEGGRN